MSKQDNNSTFLLLISSTRGQQGPPCFSCVLGLIALLVERSGDFLLKSDWTRSPCRVPPPLTLTHHPQSLPRAGSKIDCLNSAFGHLFYVIPLLRCHSSWGCCCTVLGKHGSRGRRPFTLSVRSVCVPVREEIVCNEQKVMCTDGLTSVLARRLWRHLLPKTVKQL
jgi:hypothetical protein